MVIVHMIVWISEPDASWCLVRVEERPRSFRHHNQIASDDVFCFYSVFNEYVVTHSIENDIVFNQEFVDAMDGYCSVVTRVDRVAFNVGLINSADHMEVNGVSPNLKGLTHVGELNVCDVRRQ